jgi:hypothetical protein
MRTTRPPLSSCPCSIPRLRPSWKRKVISY